jgi:betaine-aldehyde dehydrogenase
MVRQYNHWINGQSYEPATGSYIERRSPANGEKLAEFAAGTSQDLDAAVRAARVAFESRVWSGLPASERGKILEKLAQLIDRDANKLAAIESEEVGKPIKLARGEVGWSAELTRFAAALAWQIPGAAHSHLGESMLGLVTHEARGVVGVILPWNYPMVTLFQKLPYALAAGCTLVIKPSELTSGTALEIAKLAVEAGVPNGVVNVVTGTGENVGAPMAAHPDVDMVSFTGSTVVGKKIAIAAAETVKHVTLELGGKSPNIVFADADVDAALDGVLFGFTLNQGEECVAGSRLLVEKSIASDFVARLAERAKLLKIGSPLDESVDIGPMIHEQHLEKVVSMLQTAEKEGAKFETGGKRITEGSLADGYYVPPTVVSHVSPEMRIFKEEVFAPVITVTSFETAEEAITLANDTLYGLGSGVWTKDIDKAVMVSQRIKAGTVWVNTYFEGAPQVPFGGCRQSGQGRENGLEGLLEFMEVKSTMIRLGSRTPVYPHTIV